MLPDPDANSQISINNTLFRFIEVPSLPGSNIVYAEIGRKAKVYYLQNNGFTYAFKVFFPEYRNANSLTGANQLRSYKDLPGLKVADRVVITRNEHRDLVERCPHFEYAVKMPWIQGETWSKYISRRSPMTWEQSYQLAYRLASTVKELEQRGMAHCDLASGNFIFSQNFKYLELVDIEDMYGPGFIKPSSIPIGTPGYNAPWAGKIGIWQPEGDRFALAVLLCEMLAWQWPDVRMMANVDESFFKVQELGMPGEKYNILQRRVSEIHPELGHLLHRAWNSKSFQDCPTAEEWVKVLEACSGVQTEKTTPINDTITASPSPTLTNEDVFGSSQSTAANQYEVFTGGFESLDVPSSLTDAPKSSVTPPAQKAPYPVQTPPAPNNNEISGITIFILIIFIIFIMIACAVFFSSP